MYPTQKEQENMQQSTVPTRLDLGDIVVDVDPAEDGVEITLTARRRSTIGIAFTRSEARQIAGALLDASAPALGEVPIEEVDEPVEIARRFPVAVTPAKYAAALKEAK